MNISFSYCSKPQEIALMAGCFVADQVPMKKVQGYEIRVTCANGKTI
jgi:hypothetical protein